MRFEYFLLLVLMFSPVSAVLSVQDFSVGSSSDGSSLLFDGYFSSDDSGVVISGDVVSRSFGNDSLDLYDCSVDGNCVKKSDVKSHNYNLVIFWGSMIFVSCLIGLFIFSRYKRSKGVINA